MRSNCADHAAFETPYNFGKKAKTQTTPGLEPGRAEPN
jgi:hypothetical protein